MRIWGHGNTLVCIFASFPAFEWTFVSVQWETLFLFLLCPPLITLLGFIQVLAGLRWLESCCGYMKLSQTTRGLPGCCQVQAGTWELTWSCILAALFRDQLDCLGFQDFSIHPRFSCYWTLGHSLSYRQNSVSPTGLSAQCWEFGWPCCHLVSGECCSWFWRSSDHKIGISPLNKTSRNCSVWNLQWTAPRPVTQDWASAPSAR